MKKKLYQMFLSNRGLYYFLKWSGTRNRSESAVLICQGEIRQKTFNCEKQNSLHLSLFIPSSVLFFLPLFMSLALYLSLNESPSLYPYLSAANVVFHRPKTISFPISHFDPIRREAGDNLMQYDDHSGPVCHQREKLSSVQGATADGW